jgi:glutathione peroxidase
MRRVALPVVGAFCAAACGCGGGGGGGEGGSAQPAAARDETVQRAAPAAAAAGRARRDADVLRGTYARLNGERDDLARYRGAVVLVVNTATECGFTPQFEGLEALYRKRRGDGLVVLGFPANDFAGQEPRSNEDIAKFCRANYGVSFPMFAKTTVVGRGANPLFRRLATAAGAPEWNFNKYLLDRRGRVVARYGAGTEPDAPELVGRIERLLQDPERR